MAHTTLSMTATHNETRASITKPGLTRFVGPRGGLRFAVHYMTHPAPVWTIHVPGKRERTTRDYVAVMQAISDLLANA